MTFLTALIWGLGVSLGASVGFMVFVVLFSLTKPFLESKEAKAIGELSLVALNRRNELTEQQVAYLERIAETLEEQNK